VLKMEDFELIRRLVLVDGLSQREVARRLNTSRKSIRKALVNSEPESYRRSVPRSCPITDPIAAIVKNWLGMDQSKPQKQRHTKTRIFERLRDEYQFAGSRRAVSDLVNRLVSKPVEVFCPIDHPPGREVQIDWGEATVTLAGEDAKVMIFCARSAYSKATFVRAYMRDDMVSFLDAHVWLFERLGGVPKKLAYDNLKTAVTHVYAGNKRDLTARFVALRSHYLFESRFCNVASGNEKGHVENSVKRSERTYLTPLPQVATLAALQEHLENSTIRDLNRVDATTKLTYGTLLQHEREIFRELPASSFLACTTQSLRVDKRATVPHVQSRYSVPVEYATKHIVLRAFVDRIEVLYEDRIIATHDRVEPGQWSLQLAHYVALLETKPGLLDSGKPFVKQAWTASQQLFRSELEYRYQGEGTRRFIDVLLLAKRYDWKDVCRAIDACCKTHAFNEQAVLMELQRASVVAPTATIDLTDRPLLQHTGTGTRSLACYDSLIAEDVPCYEDTVSNDANGERVSREVARSANDDVSQDKQTGITTSLPSARIAPAMLEATGYVIGVLASRSSL
jgi:transposase